MEPIQCDMTEFRDCELFLFGSRQEIFSRKTWNWEVLVDTNINGIYCILCDDHIFVFKMLIKYI